MTDDETTYRMEQDRSGRPDETTFQFTCGCGWKGELFLLAAKKDVLERAELEVRKHYRAVHRK